MGNRNLRQLTVAALLIPALLTNACGPSKEHEPIPATPDFTSLAAQTCQAWLDILTAEGQKVTPVWYGGQKTDPLEVCTNELSATARAGGWPVGDKRDPGTQQWVSEQMEIATSITGRLGLPAKHAVPLASLIRQAAPSSSK